jgi:hypothetical protein
LKLVLEEFWSLIDRSRAITKNKTPYSLQKNRRPRKPHKLSGKGEQLKSE